VRGREGKVLMQIRGCEENEAHRQCRQTASVTTGRRLWLRAAWHNFARVFKGEGVRERGVLIGARRRRNWKQIVWIEPRDRAVSGRKFWTKVEEADVA
jgi:hypothetical protein